MEQNLHKIDPALVVVAPSRIRKDFDEAKIRKLAESFKKYGQISPGLCRRDGDDSIHLIAGERRLRACKLANRDFSFVFSDDVDSITLREIELEENIQRENLNWQEEVDAKHELHALKQDQHGVTQPGKTGGHGIKDTAAMLGESPGNVAEDLELATYAEHFEEVAEAKKKTDAKKIVKRIKAELKQKIKLQEAIIKEQDTDESVDEVPSVEQQLLYFSKRIICDKMELGLDQFPDNHFKVVIWDPPWQVGLDKVRKKGGGTRDFKDGDDPEFEGFKIQLEQVSKKMAVGSHLYLFFGIVHYKIIYQLLREAGLDTNGIPLIWYKQGSHVTRNPTIWPGRSYEPIAYARKGAKNLVRQGAPDVIISPMPTESLKQSHPSAKHPDVMLDLLKRSCEPGDTVLDPMCGSGMTGVAAEVLRHTHKLDWHMIEMDDSFRTLAITNVTQGYSKLVAFKTTAVNAADYAPAPLPEDFRELEIGTDRWRQFWEENPDEQGDMLAWKKERTG